MIVTGFISNQVRDREVIEVSIGINHNGEAGQTRPHVADVYSYHSGSGDRRMTEDRLSERKLYRLNGNSLHKGQALPWRVQRRM